MASVLKKGLNFFYAVLMAAAVGWTGEPPSVLKAISGEVDRGYKAYSTQVENPLYYLSCSVVESGSYRLSAAWGGITDRKRETERLMDLNLRVGSPELDNTHRAWGEGGPAVPVSSTDDPAAIASDVWLETERRYRAAVEKYAKVVAERAVKVKEEDTSPDFCDAPKVSLVENPSPVSLDESAWETVARRVSAVFRKHPAVLDSQVVVSLLNQTRTFADSSGTAVVQFSPLIEVQIWASARAEDGMEFSLYRNFPVRDPGRLPGAARLEAEADGIAGTLAGLKTAPMVDPFIGPAILSGRAAAVLFHEVLGHRLEGHRQKDEDASQTFTKKINKRILPEFITIMDDPTRTESDGTILMGHYRVDDEGVRARSVTLVDRGILRAFLMSRSPVKGFPESNGHGRCSPGQSAVPRQANLIVSSSRKMPSSALRRELIRLCREKKKPYGLIFEEIEGGFTFSGRTVPNAFNVMPQVVRRVYIDGRPDELVRGVDLIGTPLAALEKIVAAGDDAGVFNGWCGAESGWVPVSAVSPSLLFSEVEVQRKQKGQERLPLLPPPAWMAGHHDR
jgi:predicted Zn-dependent protease